MTVTGAKNAQLICIRDEDSIVEQTDNENKNEAKQSKATKITTGPNDIYGEKTSKTNIKISRLPKKPLRQLPTLPKDYALNVIQYKLDYHKNSKKNHMYRKSSSIQPWILTGK